jgi:hypothetical protein
MNRNKWLMGLVVALGASVLGTPEGTAAPKASASKASANKASKKKGARAPSGPAHIDKKIALAPKSLRFGMSLDELSGSYAIELDRLYVPKYKAVEPGPRMQELDAEVSDKKQRIKRNFLEFGGQPSGLDNGPLGGEFTYNNGESYTRLPLPSGVTRYFFFMNKRLWKIFDEHKLSGKSKLGKDFDDVVANLTKKLGKEPRVRKSSPPEKLLFDTADWADDRTILRVYDMGRQTVGLLYIDKMIEENLGKHRKDHGRAGTKITPDVAKVTRD